MAEIPYIQGYPIKPYYINGFGIVVFTDGVTDTKMAGSTLREIEPNQKQCEAYGYTYDSVSGTCRAYAPSSSLVQSFENINNTVQGIGNVTESGANNSYIMGELNTIKSRSFNNIIIGNSNQITDSISNTAVFGTLGEATTSNSIVLGGNAAGDRLAERQNIQLMYGVQTTDGTTTASYLNNTSGSYFVVPDNTIIFFHAYVVAVRIGGSYGTGAVGDYGSWVERGVVINKSGTLSVQRERDTIKTSGTTTGWVPTAAIDGTNFVMNVKGRNNVTIEWNSNISITQIKTGVAL
jgi:hypothetical protein